MGKGPRIYFERRDPLEAKEFSKLWREFSKVATEARMKALPRIAFVMLKPDALVGGSGEFILDRLRSEGLSVRLARRVKLDEERLNSLYLFVRARYRETWWLSEEFYLGREVLALLLHGSPGEFPHLPARLREEVGPTTPDAGSPGNIRYDYKGVNRLMNMIHASEDPASSLREALVFFRMEDVLEAMTTDADVRAEPGGGENNQKLRRWVIFNKIKGECARRLDDASSALLKDLLEREREILKFDLPIDEERRLLAPIEASIARRATESIRERAVEFRGEIDWAALDDETLAVWLIALLSDEALLAGERGFRRLVDEALTRGIVEDDLERLVLLSTWGTMPQMIRDLERAGKTVLTYVGTAHR